LFNHLSKGGGLNHSIIYSPIPAYALNFLPRRLKKTELTMRGHCQLIPTFSGGVLSAANFQNKTYQIYEEITNC
jgi:hypothetical protein